MTNVKIKKITHWIREYEFLSMEYLSRIYWGGAYYPSLRHALLATKTNNDVIRENIRKATLDQLDEIELRIVTRLNWNASIYMRDLLALKFGMSQIMLPDPLVPMKLFKLLAQTGQADLEFHNRMHDNYWGICDCGDFSRGCEPAKAYNYLGHALQDLRSKIQKKIQQYNPHKKCHCGNDATGGVLYSIEWDIRVSYFCDNKECKDTCINKTVRESSDKIVLDYNPETGSSLTYVPAEEKVKTLGDQIKDMVEADAASKSESQDTLTEAEMMEYYGYSESGVWVGVGNTVDTAGTSSTSYGWGCGVKTTEDRKWETIIIKGSVR